MAFISNFVRSLKKSHLLRKLQAQISPPHQNINDVMNNMLNRDLEEKRTEAIERFLDLCVSDENINTIMKKYDLSREDLRNIYHHLEMSGAGQWRKYHYVSLSSIAYPEPLYFYVESKNCGMSDIEVAFTLIEYWDKKIKLGDLYKRCNSQTPAYAGVTGVR